MTKKDGKLSRNQIYSDQYGRSLKNQILLSLAGGRWVSPGQIAQMTGAPARSVTARLRDLRKDRFGGYIIIIRRCKNRRDGLWEYRIESKKHHAERTYRPED